MSANGNLKSEIVRAFKLSFEKNCQKLLLRSFDQMCATERNFRTFSENDITAQLVGSMKSDPERHNLKISVHRESYIDSADVVAGLASADESSRIDIKYGTWNGKVEHEYHMEAKNLAEKDWKKPGSTTVVKASFLQNRYINTGIDNFVNGKYPNGCLLGYILEGEPDKITEKINLLLEEKLRKAECLNRFGVAALSTLYYSKYNLLELKHLFLKFA